jgi:magnesium-transporting ATPase (P-type)
LEVIECFFPDTVDILPKDQGMYAGTKPVVFPGTSEQSLLNFFMSQRTGASIEFGHEQTIIVREKKDKKKLPKMMKVCLVIILFYFIFIFIFILLRYVIILCDYVMLLFYVIVLFYNVMLLCYVIML